MSTEAIIALVALFIACVPGVRFLVNHRQKITQWWNRTQGKIFILPQLFCPTVIYWLQCDHSDNYQPGNKPERHPTSNAQYNTYSTAQFNPSYTRIDRNDLLSSEPQLPVSTLEISYPTLPPYNPMFSPPFHRGMRTSIISQTMHTTVLAGPGKKKKKNKHLFALS